MLSIFILIFFFFEKAVFSEEIAKNCFGDAFDHFLEKRATYTKNEYNFFLIRLRYQRCFIMKQFF